MTDKPKWYRRARRFILTQRIEELNRAIVRYPVSDRYQARVTELAQLQQELEALDADQ